MKKSYRTIISFINKYRAFFLYIIILICFIKIIEVYMEFQVIKSRNEIQHEMDIYGRTYVIPNVKFPSMKIGHILTPERKMINAFCDDESGSNYILILQEEFDNYIRLYKLDLLFFIDSRRPVEYDSDISQYEFELNGFIDYFGDKRDMRTLQKIEELRTKYHYISYTELEKYPKINQTISTCWCDFNFKKQAIRTYYFDENSKNIKRDTVILLAFALLIDLFILWVVKRTKWNKNNKPNIIEKS